MAAAPPPVIAAPAAPAVRSYRAFYDDAANDPYAGHYEAVVARFSADPVAPAVVATPAELAESIYDITRRPGPAFLLYCRPAYDPAGLAPPRIRLFHRLGKYGGEIALPTIWDGTAFAFVGDVVPPHADITSVVWTQNYFFRTAAMRVQHQDTFIQALAAEPDADLVGPFGAADAATTDVHRVRIAAYVPNRYINLFLAQDLSPRQAWERAFAAIEADGLTDVMSDLLFWLRAAMTSQVAGAGSPLIVPHPVAPLPNADLIGDRRHHLFTDLPALSNGAVAEGAELIAGAVGHLADQHRQFRDADEERKAADNTKTPDHFLGTAVESLLRVAQVATANDLPRMWQDLAAATKKSHQRNIIQRAFDEALNQISPGGGRAYIVTPSVANTIVGLEYRMANPDALSTGLQPFILTQTSSSEREAAQSRVNIFDTVMGGGANASVTDAEALVSNDPAVLPRTFPQARASLTVFQAFLLATLGEAHTWTLAMRRFLLRMSAREMELEELKPRDPQYRNLVPTLIVRWIQLRWDDWLQTQWYGFGDQPAPDLTTLFSDFRVGTAWEPTIPAQYLRLQQPAPGIPAAGVSPPAGPPRSVPAGGAGTSSTPPGTVVRNTTYSETDFGAYRADATVKVRDLYNATGIPPTPISSHDSPANRWRPDVPLRICLSYHVKAMCNSRCGRAGDHRPLTADKRQELLAWCSVHYHGPAPAT